MSGDIQLQDTSGTDESITEAELLCLTTDVQFSIAIVDDEPPMGHSLLRALGLNPNQARVFGIKDAATAYRLFLSKPFPFDAVFVDWRLETWPTFGTDLAGITGVPDNMERAPALTTIFVGDEHDRTHQGVCGGHSQLLVSLAAAHGALTIAFSQYIEPMSPDGMALRARGAHAFLAKSELGEPDTSPSVMEIKELLYVMGGWSRDLRLWRSIQPEQFVRVIEALRKMTSSEIAAKMSKFEGIGPKGRHDWLTARAPADIPDYLVGSLTNLAKPRLACSARLLAEAMPLLQSSDPRADGILEKIAILQPSLCTPQGMAASLALRLKSHIGDIEKAHSSCELETDCDYLHVIVNADVRRIDYYASKRPAFPATGLQIEHLGTSFEPKLAATMDANGVWPASKVSKLRHLLRASRDRRIFHQDGVIVQCAPGVFGPTIDSLVLGSVLMKLLRVPQLNSSVRRLVEVGTGTGFVLCLAASRLKDTAEMIAGSDVSTDAIQCATHNLKLAWQVGLKEGKAHLVLSSDILAVMPAASVDLIISNPPYLPGKPGTLAEHDSAIAGERVLRDVLCGSGPRALRENGVVIIVASTLSDAFVDSALAEAKQHGIHWQHERLVRIPGVPLDLPEVLEDFEWTSALVEMKADDVLLDVTSAQYPLRHGVVVTVFSRSPSALKHLQDAFRPST